MSFLDDEVRAYIGKATELETACDVVEAGAVRRYSQAIMDSSPFYSADSLPNDRYGGAVAPPLYPLHIFRRPLGTTDLISERAGDADFDGVAGSTTQGLPELPLAGRALLHGGMDIELWRYARHGESICAKSRYRDIYERAGSKGPLIFVVIETEYTASDGDLLLRVARTLIRR